jgi:adenylate cyclase
VSPAAVERRLAAIVSADVAGYSRLMADDETATIRTLTAYRKEIQALVAAHGGRIVDAPGDNVLAELPTALGAVQAALEIQRVLASHNAGLPEKRRMEFRIGVHMGDVAVEDDRTYGDAVNIAARLEGLAEPGGICISGAVQEQVARKLSVELEDLGDQSLKNIAIPVRAFRARPSVAKAPRDASIEPEPEPDALTVPGFSGRAIAVLPFENLSGDPDQEYFADGIAEDLITRLSLWHVFPVIARNSSFAYKGRAVDVKQVSRELGVRYVVEGSVRKAGERVRITAQLIDAVSGLQIWAERYDRELRDVFVLQDEITEAIVGSMSPELHRREQQRAVSRTPRDLGVWDYVQRGFWHFTRFNQQDNAKARSLFEEAARLDPESASAFYGLAWTHYIDIFSQWTSSVEQSAAELERAAQRSAALDDEDPGSQLALGLAHRVAGRREQAAAAFRLATQLNPSLAYAHFALGSYLSQAGRPDDAIASLEKAIRLSPRDPMLGSYIEGIAVAHFAAGRYEASVECAQQSLQRSPDFPNTHSLLAASYAHLGRTAEAQAALQQVLRLQPGYSVSTVRAAYPSAASEFIERYVEGLRRAGLQEE